MKFPRWAIAGLAVGVSAFIPAAASAATTYSVAPNLGAGFVNSLPDPGAAPAGANVSGCTSSVDRYPVILVNGTFSNPQDDYGALAPTLANAGYCIYTFSMGGSSSNVIQTVGPVPTSARELATEVQTVLAQTGAGKVDLIGHSQGGLVAEYYAKLLGGAQYVHDIVGLSPTTHGTDLNGFLTYAGDIPGALALINWGFAVTGFQGLADQETGSAVVDAVDNGAIAQAGVNYTIIETKNETVVTPVGSSFIQEPGVTNEYVQSFCPSDDVDHADLSYDNVVFTLIENALTPTTARTPNCSTEYPDSAQ